MKAIKYLFMFTLLLGSLVSCDSDLEKITVNTDEAVVGALKADATTIVMDVQQREEVAVKLTWDKTDYKAPVAPVYEIQLDLAGKGFANKIIVSSSRDLEKSIIAKDLNGYLINLRRAYPADVPANQVSALNVEMRLAVSFSSAAKILYSQPLALSITPFLDEAPKIYIVGDYCSWSHGNAQNLYSPDFSDVYKGMIFFDGKAANGFKVCAKSDWSGPNWGTGATMNPTGTSTLDVTGGNIDIFTKSWYEFEFNKATAELKVVNSYDQWAIVGSLTGWGGSPDKAMTLARDDKGAYMTATLDFPANTEFKLRADSDWAHNIGVGQIAKGEGYTGDGNFVVAEAGNYTVKWYFNKTEQELYVIKN